VPEPVKENTFSWYPIMFNLIKWFTVGVAVVVPIYDMSHYGVLALVFVIAHFESKKNK